MTRGEKQRTEDFQTELKRGVRARGKKREKRGNGPVGGIRRRSKQKTCGGGKVRGLAQPTEFGGEEKQKRKNLGPRESGGRASESKKNDRRASRKRGHPKKQSNSVRREEVRTSRGVWGTGMNLTTRDGK